MPSHITHMLLAEDIYKQGNLVNINKDYFITFSLGADLSKYSKVRKLSHKVKQKELILNMCQYLKDNQLIQDEILLATMYGHVAHMIADKIIHPLIYQETRACKNKKIKNHTLIESHYDAYLLKEKLTLKVEDFNLRKQLRGQVSKVSKMIDYAYYRTYGYKHISRYYRLMLILYRGLDVLYKVLGVKLLVKISKYQSFKKDNLECINYQEFVDCYSQCISDSLEKIKKIDLNLKSASN